MEFHPWQTLVDEAGKLHGKDWRKMSIQARYASELQALIEYQFRIPATRTKRLVRLAIETRWEQLGKPYYNIHPQMATKLAKTNLDKIPARFIEIPNEYDCIHVRFSDDIPLRFRDLGQHFHVVPQISKEQGLNFRSALFGRFNFDNEPLVQRALPDTVGEDQFVLITDEGFRTNMQSDDGKETVARMLCNTIHFGIRPDETIPQALERAIDEAAETPDGIMLIAMKQRLMDLFKIICTTGFLCNCPEDRLVVPEVLSKDQRKYQEALNKGDQAAIDTIVNRAQRRGKKGWNVGTDELFVPNFAAQPRSQSTATGKELQYSHIRGGHPHAVRFGPKKSKVKIKWFRPTRVREDLPFKEE